MKITSTAVNYVLTVGWLKTLGRVKIQVLSERREPNVESEVNPRRIMGESERSAQFQHKDGKLVLKGRIPTIKISRSGKPTFVRIYNEKNPGVRMQLIVGKEVMFSNVKMRAAEIVKIVDVTMQMRL